MTSEQNPVKAKSTAERVAAAGLPAMNGTPEEVEAAEPIRLSLLIAADERLTQLRSNLNQYEGHTAEAIPTPAVMPKQVADAEEALRRLRHEKSAPWWLANREADVDALLGGALG